VNPEYPEGEPVKPYPALTVANWFIEKSIKESTPISHMKLQKLLYFAHGYCLATLNAPLLGEKIQAWKYGPVVATVYYEFEYLGSTPISAIVDDYPLGDIYLDAGVTKLLGAIWRALSPYSPFKLSQMTHLKGCPYEVTSKVEGRRYEQRRPMLISNALLETYFSHMMSGKNA
jgi:uncharacterized phage-associated protein